MVLRRTLMVSLLIFVFPQLCFSAKPAAGRDWGSTVFIAWSPDGTMLSLSNQTHLDIVEASTRQVLNSVSGLNLQVTPASWSPDGRRLAVANGNEVQIWYEPWVPGGQQIVDMRSTPSWVFSLAWSPSGDQIAVAYGATVELWDSVTLQTNFNCVEHTNAVRQVSWSSSGSLLASASLDDTVRYWDASTGELISTMTLITDFDRPIPDIYSDALSVSWSPDGNELAIGTGDGSVRIWNRNSQDGAEVLSDFRGTGIIFGHEDLVLLVTWNPNGPQIASASQDGTVRIWDSQTGTQIQVFHVGMPIGSLDWSPDGMQLAFGGEGGVLQIVSLESPPV